MTLTWDSIAEISRNVTVIAMFVIVILSGSRGIWVWRRELDSQVEATNYWRDAFFKLAETTNKTIDVAKVLKDEAVKST